MPALDQAARVPWKKKISGRTTRGPHGLGEVNDAHTHKMIIIIGVWVHVAIIIEPLVTNIAHGMMF